MAVTASDRGVVTIVDAGTGPSSGVDATAFTGSGAAVPATAMVILATLGAVARLMAHRRRI